jgi:hypothetical protein
VCFIYLAFDIAPKEVVWHCKIRWAGGPGVPGTLDGTWNLKTSLSADWCNHVHCHHAQWCFEQLLTQNRLPCQLAGQCSQEDSFLILQTSPGLPACLIWQYQNTAIWSMTKARHMEHVLPKTDGLKQWIQECIQVIHKEMLQYVIKSFPRQMQKCTKWHGNHLQSVIFE